MYVVDANSSREELEAALAETDLETFFDYSDAPDAILLAHILQWQEAE